MKFHLSEEQMLMQESLRRALGDLGKARRAAFETEDEAAARPVFEALNALGLFGIAVPEEYGGQGLGLLDLALAAEILGEAAAPGPFFGHVLAEVALAQCPDEAIKARWLPAFAEGRAIGACAIPESWMPELWTMPESGGCLSGEVGFVPGAKLADVIVVGTQGGGLALVEVRAPGVTLEARDSSDRTRRVSRLVLERTPRSVIAAPGAAQVARLVDAGLVLLAADALGGAQHCLHLAVDYAKAREQFGVVIGRFQALKHQLANMALEIEPARALVWYAGYAYDSGANDARRAAAQAKAHLADRFTSVARAAVEAHGGIGYSWDYDLQIWFKRALFDRAYLGSPSLHRERAARLAGW